jgi:signal transduction histidine kinase
MTKTLLKSHSVLDNTLFKSPYIDRNGTLWAGTNAGIYRILGNNIKTITTKEGLSDGRVFCFLEDHQGRILAGTRAGGINVINEGKISVIDTKDGLGSNLVLCMCEDIEGTIWVGTGDKGLNRIDGKTGKVSQLDSLAPDQPAICQILEDNMRNLWIGTAYGIFVVKKDEINGYVKGLNKLPGIINFREEDGLKGGSVGGVFPAGCVTPLNKLWFSTTEGIAERPMSPAVTVISVKVNKKELEKRDTYNIPAGVIYLEINYSAPSFIAPEKLMFRYKLAGYDQDWTEAGDRRFALYTKVPHGDYNFIIEVRDYRGNLSPYKATVKIHVNPYFYQTWWFRFLCLIFILGIVYGIFTFRIRQVRDKELEILVLKRTDEIRKLNESLEQQVTERTAQLTATNTELEAFSYSVSHDLKAPVRRIEGLIQALIEDYEPQLDKNALDFLNKINESVVSMNILIEELLKLSRIARQEIEKTDVDLAIIAMEIGEKLRRTNPDRMVELKIQQHMIVKADARLVQIALQNLFENAWKYTGKLTKAKIEFGMTVKNEKETIFIRDNGVGFDMGQYGKLFTPFQRLHSEDQFIGTGLGLATVKRIIMKHGGWICAESEPGNGATFYFTLS